MNARSDHRMAPAMASDAKTQVEALPRMPPAAGRQRSIWNRLRACGRVKGGTPGLELTIMKAEGREPAE